MMAHSTARGIDVDCRWCRWWAVGTPNPGLSETTHREGRAFYHEAPCERHAPAAQQTDFPTRMTVVFPLRGPDDGCGDFERFRINGEPAQPPSAPIPPIIDLP